MDIKKINWWMGSSYVFSSEYQTILNFATANSISLPSMKTQIADDTFIRTLKSIAVGGSNAWATIDIFFAYYAENSAFATLNWKNPSLFRTTLVSSPTFTSYSGFSGDGIASYLNTNWAPGTNGVNFTQNACTIGEHAINLAVGKLEGSLSSGSARTGWSLNWVADAGSGGQIVNQLNTTTAGAVTSTDATFKNQPGLYFFEKSSSTASTVQVNESSSVSNTLAGSGISTQKIYLGAFNNNGIAINFSTQTIAMFFAGGDMSQSVLAQISQAWFTRLSQMDVSGNLKLILHHGQSNAVGSNTLTDDTFSNPAYLTPSPPLQIFDNPATSTLSLPIHSTSTYDATNNGKGSLYGADASYMKDLATAGVKNVFLFKFAIGSTALLPTTSSVYYWHPTDNTFPSFRLYPKIISGLNECINILYRMGHNKNNIKIIFYWDQGEADNDFGVTQSAYYNALNALDSALKTDAAPYYNGHMILRRMYYPTPATSVVRLSDVQFCNDDPTNRKYVDSDSGPFHAGGNIHLTIHGQEIVGQEVAAAMIAAGWMN